MGRRQTPGLQCRQGIWHIDKIINGKRLCQSTETGDREEAEAILAQLISEARKEKVFGVRKKRIFREAATRYLLENSHKSSIKSDGYHLADLDPFIGDLPIDQIHDETLASFKEAMRVIRKVRKDGSIYTRPRKNKSINLALSVVRRILNLSARKWRDEMGKTWLEAAPLLSFLDTSDSRPPYPLSWVEQRVFFLQLPALLASMSLFKVNTGCREQEVCKLEWEWEVEIPELETSVFVVPADFGGRDGDSGVKNGEDRVIVLNHIARSVVESQRGKDEIYVFAVSKGTAYHRMNNNTWDRCIEKAAQLLEKETGKPASKGFKTLHVHDLKHTFGRRLRASGVSNETRKTLLGHANGDITTHYSAAEIGELLSAANRVCGTTADAPTLTLIRSQSTGSHAKVTQKRKRA